MYSTTSRYLYGLKTTQNDKRVCSSGVGIQIFNWLGCGFGYNMNQFLNAWVDSAVIGKHDNVSVVTGEGMLGHIDCFEESGGLVSEGFICLFDDMPHLCTLNSTQDWENHMIAGNVSEETVKESKSMVLDVDGYDWSHVTWTVDNIFPVFAVRDFCTIEFVDSKDTMILSKTAERPRWTV